MKVPDVIEHLIELTERVLNNDHPGTSSFALAREMHQQLSQLDPRDFDPAKRAEFMVVRAQFAGIANPLPNKSISGSMVNSAFVNLRPILDFYRGEGSHLDSKPFSFTRQTDLADIIRRDYADLCLRVYPSRAWKSAVVLAGSILEAVLYDVLTDPKNQANADAYAASQPQHANKGSILAGRWTLEALIDVAVGINLLRSQDEKIVHQTLRDFRNFIHPMKEIRTLQSAGANEAGLALNALNAIIDHLESNFQP
jgi:hypothetical protein